MRNQRVVDMTLSSQPVCGIQAPFGFFSSDSILLYNIQPEATLLGICVPFDLPNVTRYMVIIMTTVAPAQHTLQRLPTHSPTSLFGFRSNLTFYIQTNPQVALCGIIITVLGDERT